MHRRALPLLALFALLTLAAARGRGPGLQDVVPGWTPLFDGRTLTGWTPKGGPYDGHARWTIEDGAITGRQGPNREGGLLYTERLYTDFELRCEVRIDYPFDSGLFLRMVPDARGAQVTIDHRPGGEIGAIYSDGYLEHNPAGAERYRKGEWNHFRVRCEGIPMQVRAWMNGEELITWRHVGDPAPFARAGRIGIQVHGGEEVALETRAQFRELFVRELPALEGPDFEDGAEGRPALTESGLRRGWRSLVDPELAAWEPAGAEGVRVEDGVMVVGSGHADLVTRADFQDLELRLDFRIGELTNSGLFLRAARDGSNPAYSGCEVQILDDLNWERSSGSTLQPWQFTGSLYGAVPAGKPSRLRLAPEWNSYEVLYLGSRLRVRLNGHELYDVDTLTLGDAKPPFAERAARGFIGFQRHGAATAEAESQLAFRDVFVRDL